MGRNIFQADAPEAMIQAVRRVVHENATPEQAFDVYMTLKSEGNGPRHGK
jgi:putative autoinducer-2 (AI-2) aldolase